MKIIFFFALIIFGGFEAVSETNQKSDERPMGQFTKPPREELKKKLTSEQYRCTQEAGTERPFENAYWNHHE